MSSIQRTLSGRTSGIVYAVAILTSVFHLWVNTVGVVPEIQRNAIHFGLVLLLAYLYYPASRSESGPPGVRDWGLAVCACATALYLLIFEDALHARNEVPNTTDLVFAAAAVLLLLEITRRTCGSFIPLLAIAFLTYALFWGRFMGGVWHFPGVSISRILYRMYFAPDGIFGTIATVSSTFVFLFVLFGAFLLRSGAGEFLIRLALALLGTTVGGPAKMAALASGLLGSISGSAVANTVGSGSLTIPMMKRVGFSPTFAAAVEAAASTGGQLMPPIMGAGAFIMSQWTQIPYLHIVAVSFIPAGLYFLSVIFFVHLRAKKEGIRALDPEDVPRVREVLRDGWHFFLPIAVLVGLLIYGFTPTFAAAASTLAIVLSSWLNRQTRMGLRDILDALALGARNMVSTGVILLCAGIVVGVVLLVGVGIKFSLLIAHISGSSLLLTVILVAAASLILGMGLPVTASYIVLAVLTAPALTTLGVSLLAAHLLIFWYSQDANVTPPVCLAAYSAAGIAGSDPLRTGLQSWKIAKGLYLIPLLFCYTPILFEGDLWRVLETTVSAALGLFAFAAAFEAFHLDRLGIPLRLLYGLAAVLLLWPQLALHAAGLAFFIMLVGVQKIGRPPDPQQAGRS
ncbi:MAG: TRAP transporter fused permease subunit [Candidatus Latescibacteria bacterium]|nr:TRAP transporter fused permease subunit [Candidatus Latescibacterota bacterium]